MRSFFRALLLLGFVVLSAVRVEAEGSERSIGLHYWLKGNNCYRSENWNCAVSSWAIALSLKEFIEWQEAKSTLNGLAGLTHATILDSEKCINASSIEEVNSTARVIAIAVETLSQSKRLSVSPDTLKSWFLPSLSMCSALLCQIAGNSTCVDEQFSLLEVERLSDPTYLLFLAEGGVLPSNVADLVRQQQGN